MKQYYLNVQKKILVQRDIIRSLLKDPKVIGDYYEAIIMEAVRESISEYFAVRRGVILSDSGQSSRECDIIVYSAAEYGPLFLSGDIVVINPEAVRCVIQVKGTLNHENLHEAIKNLDSVNRLRPGIWKLIVGFNTNLLYNDLVKMCADSSNVNGLFVFSSTNKSEKEDIALQMQHFVELLKLIAAPTMYQTKDAGNYVALKTSGEGKIEGVPFPD
jgi:fructose-bisphosphate aldolase class 1